MSDKKLTPPLPIQWPEELATPSPDLRWLVEPLWLRTGVGVIGGTPKSYKTWLALEIATAAATDTPCLGRFPVRAPGAALLCLAEHELPAVRERLAALAKARHRPLLGLNMRIITAPSLRLNLDEDMRRLAATVRDIRPRLLVLDPLAALLPDAANDAKALAHLLERLRAIQRHYDVAVLLVHHTGPSGSPRGHRQAPCAADDLLAWSDSNIILTRNDGAVTLTAHHRSAPDPKPLSLCLTGELPSLLAVDLDAHSARRSLEDRLVEQLRLQDRPISRPHLRALLDTEDHILQEVLTRLHKLGAIQPPPDDWSA